MSDIHPSWFHCGRCGSLFLSPAGEKPERICGKCGKNPSLGIEESLALLPAKKLPFVKENKAAPLTKQKKGLQKNQLPNSFVVKLVGGWLLLIAFIIVVARFTWPEPAASQASDKIAPKLDSSAEDTAFINQAKPSLDKCILGFIQATTPEERNQFVLNPINTASRMARFNDLNPQIILKPENLKLSHYGILNIPGIKAIETIWSTESDGQVDAVFVQQDDEWRLDWEHFARFSTYPLSLFLAGSGNPEEEFRLLARERLAEERKNADNISLALYAPRFGWPKETGFQTPEFLVDRKSEDGKLLTAAFKLANNNKRPFQLNLPQIDSESFIRVRVKLRRIEELAGRRFELVKIMACHWYATDETGVELPEPAAPQE